MSLDDHMRERHGRVLAELAETGMVMVRRLSEAVLRTDDAQTQAQLGLAYHRAARAVRQTIMLELRLAQGARREDRSASPPRPTSPDAKPATPRPQTERVGWDEYERHEPDEALDALDELLEADEVDIDTVQAAIETSIARIERDLAADPLLVKAGVLAPAAGGRRQALMSAASFSPSGRDILLPLREKVSAQPTDEGLHEPFSRSGRSDAPGIWIAQRDPSSDLLRKPPSPARGEGARNAARSSP